MRRPNWRCPCRRRKVSLSWMCMALWYMQGIQVFTKPCSKYRWAGRSEEDLTSKRCWSSQASKWAHTILYPRPKARDIADHFLHRWDASLERHYEKKGCWNSTTFVGTEERRKLACNYWQWTHGLSWPHLYYCMHLLAHPTSTSTITLSTTTSTVGMPATMSASDPLPGGGVGKKMYTLALQWDNVQVTYIHQRLF